MIKDRLIIFQKNPAIGQVKTRLSKDVGDEAALSVYMLMLEMTAEVARNCSSRILVYYSDFIDENDIWSNISSEKFKQTGKDLGERMLNSFKEQYSDHQCKTAIIGTDCPDISVELIQKSFELLDEKDFSIGPSRDGGYYLLAMRSFIPEVFEGISWSSEEVFSQTIDKIKSLNKTYGLLPPLMDIDTVEDLKENELLMKEIRSINS